MNIVVTSAERIGRMQKIFEAANAELSDVKQAAYEEAVSRNDAEGAAQLAREIRNQMLTESDKEVVLDRLGLETPSGTSFSAWLGFLQVLGRALSSDWAEYRQALRDVTKQEGFPFEIQWPEKPGS